MIEIQGKHNTAKVYTEAVDAEAFKQILELCNLEEFKDCKIRIMPDVHAGKGCTIGTALEIKDKVVPNMVGVDVGCGMYTIKIKEKRIDLPKLDSLIKGKIPSGTSIRSKEHKFLGKTRIEELRCKKEVNTNRAKLSLGTLGGGNHFIEVARGNEDIYIIIHSGSRQLGLQIANYYQEQAYKTLNGAMAKHMAYCEGKLLEDYIHDMKIAQEYADINRKAMMQDLVKGMKLSVVEEFSTIHNYIDTGDMILRKGAVSAKSEEKLLIPINMKDGSLLCKGKGNSEWNFSAPHGAGRLYSRSKVKETFTLKEYKNIMEKSGIYTTSVCKGTLDECPMAYKSIDDIVKNINDTVEIIDRLIPIYNYKAAE